MVTVAIIDDGLNYNDVKIDSKYSEFIVKKSQIKRYKSKKQNTNSHGTICAKLISACNVNDVEIISYKIKDEDKKGSVSDLVAAMNDAVKRNVNLIHMSVGSTSSNDFEMINGAVQDVLKHNICIVAAIDNEGVITYPASIGGVIGVKHNFELICKKPQIAEPNSLGIDIELCCPKIVEGIDGIPVPINYCNSFAAAKLSSIIVNYIIKGKIKHHSDVINIFAN